MPGRVFKELSALWRCRGKQDEYLGTLVNAWIAEGHRVLGVKAGTSYLDVGSVEGLHAAWRTLESGLEEFVAISENLQRAGHPECS